MGDKEQHIVFEIEVPAIYTKDIEEYREYAATFNDESEWLLNILGDPSICRLRVETSGEKDSTISEVWGMIRSARLESPGRGFGPDAHLTDDQLAAHGGQLDPDWE